MNSSRPRRLLQSEVSVLWLFALCVVLLDMAVNHRYGFHRDELLTYTNARHLDWGFEVYPPITAVLARIELALFGTALSGFRFFASVAHGLVVALTGLTARAMGGRRTAMLTAAAAAAIGGSVLFCGAFFSYMTFDLLWWVATAWGVAHLLRSENPRWFLAIGTFIGLGLETKYTMLIFAAGVLLGLLLTPNRRYLRSPWFWAGVAIAVLLVLPNALWEFHHNFLGVTWARSIHSRDVAWGWTDYFLLGQLWKVTNPVTIPLWFAGLWFLFATREGKPYRTIGWMYVVPLVILFAVRGRDYYLSPAYPMLLAAGAVWGERWADSLSPHARTRVLRGTSITLAVSGLVVASLVLPIAPLGTAWWRAADATNGNFNMEIGWPELVKTVAEVRDTLPAADRARLGILAADEGQTGAVNLYGPTYGLPQAISGMNSNWLRGYGNPPPQTVIALGLKQDFLERNFQSCTWAAHIAAPYGIRNMTVSYQPEIFVCRNLLKPWPEFWKRYQYYG
ncbi:MAG: glycosyltransferase family 39 protein [Terracidiphilus sp.]